MSEPIERPLIFECRGEALVGVLHSPGPTVCGAGVVIVVGGPQYRVGSHRQFVLMARTFARAGIAVLRFDYRGMGDSDGEVRTFEDVHDDIAAAIAVLMKEQPSVNGVVLWGLCDAASASLMYAPRDSRVSGLILVNPWVRTERAEAQAYLKHYYLQRLLQPSFWRKVITGRFDFVRSIASFFATVGLARDGRAQRGGIEHGYVERMLAGLRGFAAPVLVLISEKDLTAKAFMDLCDAHRGWRQALARPNVGVHRVDGADHTFSARDALDRATMHCVAWLRRTAA